MSLIDENLIETGQIQKGDMVTFVHDYDSTYNRITYQKGVPVTVHGRKECIHEGVSCALVRKKKTCGGWIVIKEEGVGRDYCPYNQDMSKRIVLLAFTMDPLDINIVSALSQ